MHSCRKLTKAAHPQEIIFNNPFCCAYLKGNLVAITAIPEVYSHLFFPLNIISQYMTSYTGLDIQNLK